MGEESGWEGIEGEVVSGIGVRGVTFELGVSIVRIS